MEDRLNVKEFGFVSKYTYYVKDIYSFYYFDEGNEIWILKNGTKALFSGKIDTHKELKVLLKQVGVLND